MSNNGLELSRRKVLAGLGTVGVASAGAGMGTTALFSDTESFENNSLTAGELDLRIDWQQTYRNGVAGDPGVDYVNAHPDEGKPDGTGAGDGIQSIWTDQYESIDDVGLVEYTDNGRNLQEYITCETLENHTEADFGGQDHLIELDDLKPGDSGEITFSFHLCDNPGCVWLQGGNLSEGENGRTEPEKEVDSTATDGELLENLMVRAWYDVDCDNVYEDGESKIFAWGTLDDFLSNQLGGIGYRLSPFPYGARGVQPGSTSSSTSSQFECQRLGKLEFTDQVRGTIDIADDSSGKEVDEDDETTSGDDDDDDVNQGERYRLEADGEYAVIDITGFARKEDGEIVGFYWELDDASSDLGICQIDVKGGGGAQGSAAATNSYVFEPLCIGEVNASGEPMFAPINSKNMKRYGVSNAVFYYCKSQDSSLELPCFPGQQTFCVGFEWFLPATVGNAIQSDSVSFDLGFYAEQARHNNNPGQAF